MTATTFTLSDGASSNFDPSKEENYHKTYQTPKQVTVTAQDGTPKTYKIKVQITITNDNRFNVVYGEIKRMNGGDVSGVTDMLGMFKQSNDHHLDGQNIVSTFNGNISQWDVAKVINMQTMFADSFAPTSIFNQDLSK